jgi:hypothetical protein
LPDHGARADRIEGVVHTGCGHLLHRPQQVLSLARVDGVACAELGGEIER